MNLIMKSFLQNVEMLVNMNVYLYIWMLFECCQNQDVGVSIIFAKQYKII